MSILRSEFQIQSGLRIITHAQLAAHNGMPSQLIHTTKEIASLLLDNKIAEDSLLSSRYTIHGNEIGIRPNCIFTKFMPLGQILGKYAKTFGLFTTRQDGNGTKIIPIETSLPSIDDVVDDPTRFYEEAKLLGSLTFVEKNILATHRNISMTMEAHQTVSQLFTRTSNHLLDAIEGRNVAYIDYLVNKINECADELVKKSNYYPHKATAFKADLMESKDSTRQFLASKIQPHDHLIDRTGTISKVILRGAHLVRSRLSESNLYSVPSTCAWTEEDRFLSCCTQAGLDKPKLCEIADSKSIINFLIKLVNQEFVWWQTTYGSIRAAS